MARETKTRLSIKVCDLRLQMSVCLPPRVYVSGSADATR